jgi:signal transduction histidine kinase
MAKFYSIFGGGKILFPLYLLLISTLTLIIAVVNHDARISMEQYHDLAESDASKQIMISEIIKNAANNELALLHLVINNTLLERKGEVYVMMQSRHNNDSIFTKYSRLVGDRKEAEMIGQLLWMRKKNNAARDTLMKVLKRGDREYSLAYLNTFQKTTFVQYENELKKLSDYVEVQTEESRHQADKFEYRAMSKIILLLEGSILLILLLGLAIVRVVKKIGKDNKLLSAQAQEQIRINDKLELLAERFEKAQQIAALGFYEMDLKTKKFNWSDEAYRIFGIKPGSIEPDYNLFLKYVHPEDLHRAKSITETSSKTLTPFAFRHRIVLKDGRVKSILSTGHYECDRENNPARLFGTCLDITELVKTNLELDRFVYSVSHDLRAPLTSLLGLTNLIEDDLSASDDAQKERVAMMKKSIRRLDTFISDILDYSRNGRLAVSQDAINFEELVKETRENLKFMEGTDGYNLKVDIRQKNGFISDKKRLSVILNNLISNAIKYQDINKQSPYVKVNIKTDADKALLIIEDNGIGIAPKDHEKIFEMFYRASKLSNGSGLGMYIVKETLEKIHGTIQLESEPGKGTRFLIIIPNMDSNYIVDSRRTVNIDNLNSND